MSLDTHDVNNLLSAKNSIINSSAYAFYDLVNNAFEYNHIIVFPYCIGAISGSTALIIAAPVSVAYFAHRFNHYYDGGDIEVANHTIAKTKGTEGGFVKSIQDAFPEALSDAIMIDGITYSTLYVGAKIATTTGLALANGPYAIPMKFVMMGTIGALAGYTTRKTCNNYFNEGDHNLVCGVVGGALKYSIKSNPFKLVSLMNSLKGELSDAQRLQILSEISTKKYDLLKDSIVGAFNNGLYEHNGHEIGSFVNQNNTHSLLYKVFSIEHVDAILAKSLKAEDYSPQLVLGVAASGINYI